MEESTVRRVVREELVREIGDTTEGFGYRVKEVRTGGISFTFSTPENDYAVAMNRVGEWIKIDFGVGHAQVAPVTDEGVTFRVIATVLNTAREAWERRSEFLDSPVKGFIFDPVSKAGEEPDDTSRGKLYARFIKEQFPDAELGRKGSAWYVIPDKD